MNEPDDNNENLPPKDILERLKIKAEVDSIRKPFYKDYKFYSALLPLIIGFGGLIISYSSGFFDVQLHKIENEKVLLTIEKHKLDTSIDSLNRAHQMIENNYNEKLNVVKDSLSQVKKSFSDSLRIVNEQMESELSKSARLIDKIRNQTNITEKEKNAKIDSLTQKERKFRINQTELLNEANSKINHLERLINKSSNTLTRYKVLIEKAELVQAKQVILFYMAITKRSKISFENIRSELFLEFDDLFLQRVIKSYPDYWKLSNKEFEIVKWPDLNNPIPDKKEFIYNHWIE